MRQIILILAITLFNINTGFAQIFNKEIINGLYDSFTEGYCDDYEVVKNTLSVEKKNDYYVVSFYFETWPEKKKKDINVIIYVDKDGLISHIKRPYDGLMIPEQ